jgi:hypothetical protein
MAKNDKDKDKVKDEQVNLKSIEVPQEVSDLLKAMTVSTLRPPQTVEVKSDARSDVLIAFSQTLSDVAHAVRSLGAIVVEAPNYYYTESRE